MTRRLFLAFLISCIITGNAAAQAPAAAGHKVYLHLCKNIYYPGEKIWLSAYLSEAGSNRLISSRQPLYVQAFRPDGTSAGQAVLYSANGRGFGYLQLGPELPTGIYRLRAFTRMMYETQESLYEARFVVQRPQDERGPALPAATAALSDWLSPLQVTVQTEKERFGLRERVRVRVKVKDGFKKPVAGTFSMSVVEMPLLQGSAPNGILQQMPYLPATTPATTPEAEGVLWYGVVKHRKKGEPIPNAVVILMVLDSAQRNQSVVLQADEHGLIALRGLDFSGQHEVNWQINDKKGKHLAQATIEWQPFPPRENLLPLPFDWGPRRDAARQDAPKYLADGDSQPIWVENAIALPEITVSDFDLRRDTITDKVGQIKIHTEPTFAIDFAKNPTRFSRVEDMIAMLPGVMSLGAADGEGISTFRIRGVGVGLPIFFIDGIPVQNLGLLNPNDVVRIEVISGANAAAYGMNATGGVIAIYTNRAPGKPYYDGKASTTVEKLEGYQPDRPFYAPDYSEKLPEHDSPDRRRLLYWNPEIITDAQGMAVLSFYTSDQTGHFRIVVEGMSRDNAGRGEKEIVVER